MDNRTYCIPTVSEHVMSGTCHIPGTRWWHWRGAEVIDHRGTDSRRQAPGIVEVGDNKASLIKITTVLDTNKDLKHDELPLDSAGASHRPLGFELQVSEEFSGKTNSQDKDEGRLKGTRLTYLSVKWEKKQGQ